MATAGALRDVDVFWHTRLGGELLDGVSIYDVGNDWSYGTAANQHWVSSQWLVEIMFSWLHSVGGWNALIAYRSITTAMILITLMWAASRPARSRVTAHDPRATNRYWASLITFLLGAFTIVLFSQERPQQLSFILLPIVGFWWLRALRYGTVPRWWVLLLLAAVWANCHGLWIMLPIALGLALLGQLWENGRQDNPALRPIGVGLLASIIGGCITPIGPLNLLAPLTFASATSRISEWESTSFKSPSTLGLTISILILILCWARGRGAPSRGEVLYGLVIALFGAMAGRNVTPAVLMLAPLVAWRLSLSLRWPKPRTAPPGLVTVAKPATILVCAAGVVVGGLAVAGSTAIDPAKQPVGLASKIGEREGTTRVLNGYNVSGLVLWTDRPENSSGNVVVGIDGRADRYGASYIDQYLDMEKGLPGWDNTVIDLRPNVALLPEKDPLIPLLVSRGWKITGTEAKYVLLEPATTPAQ